MASESETTMPTMVHNIRQPEQVPPTQGPPDGQGGKAARKYQDAAASWRWGPGAGGLLALGTPREHQGCTKWVDLGAPDQKYNQNSNDMNSSNPPSLNGLPPIRVDFWRQTLLP